MKKLSLVLVILFGLVVLTGCSTSPGSVVEKFFKAIEDGEITDAVGYLSTSSVQTLGEEKWRALLTEATADLSNSGGIDKVDVLSEETTGEIATVAVDISYGDGSSNAETFNLVKEDGDWKIQIDPYSK